VCDGEEALGDVVKERLNASGQIVGCCHSFSFLSGALRLGAAGSAENLSAPFGLVRYQYPAASVRHMQRFEIAKVAVGTGNP
jgi:hypothetical protein